MSEFGQFAEHGPETRYVALIGDIVDSKLIADRAGFQRRLQAAVAGVNEMLAAGELAAKLDLTAGDEIQGLFRHPEAAVRAVGELADRLVPERLVAGLGRGTLSTDPSPRVAVMDGPCFHHGRAALDRARRTDGWVAVEGFGAVTDEALSALFLLIHTLRSRWTDKQAQYARAARTRLQKDVAASFEVSPSVVSESLKAAAFDAVRAGERAAENLLAQFGPKGESDSDSASEVNW